MPSTTPNIGLTLPTPNVDTGWGGTLNADFTIIDNLFAAAGNGPSVGLNVGTGKTLSVGGTLVASGTVILGGGDGTGSITAPVIRGAARTGINVRGYDMIIQAGNGTGTEGSGGIYFRTAPQGASGSTPGTLVNKLIVERDYIYADSATAPAYNNSSILATTAQVYSTVTAVPPVQVITSRSLTLADAGSLLWSNSSGAITLTVPTAASVNYPNGTRIDILRWNTGTLTIAAAGGVYIQSAGSRYSLSSQSSGATLYKILGDSWALVGDLS